jgi:hypothetical protein
VKHSDTLDSIAIVPEGVVHRDFEAETLLLNLGTGTYHGVNVTGRRILALLRETGGDIRMSVERLAGEHGVPVAQIAGDVAEFCAELAQRGLLELSPR